MISNYKMGTRKALINEIVLVDIIFTFALAFF